MTGGVADILMKGEGLSSLTDGNPSQSISNINLAFFLASILKI